MYNSCGDHHGYSCCAGSLLLTYLLQTKPFCNSRGTNSCWVDRKYLEMDVKFPEDAARHYADIVAKHVTKAGDGFRRLLFVDSMVRTLKVW